MFSNRFYSDTFRSQNLDDLNEPTDENFNYVLKELQNQSELVKYSHDQTDQLLNITEGLTRSLQQVNERLDDISKKIDSIENSSKKFCEKDL
jgi:ABC-type transporter Mla subunit MlaD